MMVLQSREGEHMEDVALVDLRKGDAGSTKASQGQTADSVGASFLFWQLHHRALASTKKQALLPCRHLQFLVPTSTSLQLLPGEGYHLSSPH